MFSQDYIVYLSNKAAVQSVLADEFIEPYEVRDQYDVNTWEQHCPIPNLGSLRPAGWRMIDHWLVDSSGWGAAWEPALTVKQFVQRVKQNLPKRRAYAIIEEGQFQVVVGVFAPCPHAKLRLDREITQADWESMADELGFESVQDLRSYVNL